MNGKKAKRLRRRAVDGKLNPYEIRQVAEQLNVRPRTLQRGFRYCAAAKRQRRAQAEADWKARVEYLRRAEAERARAEMERNAQRARDAAIR